MLPFLDTCVKIDGIVDCIQRGAAGRYVMFKEPIGTKMMKIPTQN